MARECFQCVLFTALVLLQMCFVFQLYLLVQIFPFEPIIFLLTYKHILGHLPSWETWGQRSNAMPLSHFSTRYFRNPRGILAMQTSTWT